MDESDKKWIDENVMNNLISYQWSIKLDSGEIYMVQADTIEEFDLRIKDIKIKFLNSRTIPEQPQVPTFQPAVNPELTTAPKPASPSVICNTCGAKAYINEGVSKKSGKPYKIFKCSKFPELQKNNKGVVGHSYFL